MSPPSLLRQLQQLTPIVPETANLDVVRRFDAQHVDLSASRINSAAQMPEHDEIVNDAIGWAQQQVGKGGIRKLVAMRAVERLPVEFGRRILGIIPGRISVELDARLAYQTTTTVERAQDLADQFEEAGATRDRVLVKIPATWDGIRAARKLEEMGVHCHMTLVFSLFQLAACADAGATVVAPAVGRIYDWHKKQAGVDDFAAAEDPAVLAAARMYGYLRRHGYSTALMPGAFRGEQQALALAGCDFLSLPRQLLTVLDEQTGSVERQLDPDTARHSDIDKLDVDRGAFSKMLSADPLSNSKLSRGVKNLSWARVSQEKQLTDWIETRQDRAAKASAIALFRVWDYDGDGFIDREEWGGTDEVFNALDRDHNGRISLEEMAIGLGAPCQPDEDE